MPFSWAGRSKPAAAPHVSHGPPHITVPTQKLGIISTQASISHQRGPHSAWKQTRFTFALAIFYLFIFGCIYTALEIFMTAGFVGWVRHRQPAQPLCTPDNEVW